MKKFIKKIDELTDVRSALKLWIEAKEEAIRLDSVAKKKWADAVLEYKDLKQMEGYAKIALDTEDHKVAAEFARIKATALFNLMQYLRGANAILSKDECKFVSCGGCGNRTLRSQESLPTGDARLFSSCPFDEAPSLGDAAAVE